MTGYYAKPVALFLFLFINSAVLAAENRGKIVGATVALWLKREKELNELAARRPDIVVVMLGTNDSKGGLRKGIEPFIAEYRALILRLQDFPSRPAIICCSPPSAFENTYNIHPESISDRITPAIKRIADESGAIYIDIGAIVRERASFPDCVHPTNVGAKQIADTIEPILKKNAGLSGRVTTLITSQAKEDPETVIMPPLQSSSRSCLSWPPIWCPGNHSCGPAARRTMRWNGTRHFELRATPHAAGGSQMRFSC